MSDPLHAPTTAALELCRSGMSIGDAVDSIRARFDLTDALVIDVACRVDTALTNEARAREAEDLDKAVAEATRLEDAAREHEPGIVDAERPLAPAVDVTVELSETPREVLDAMHMLVEHHLDLVNEPGQELGDTVRFSIEISRTELARMRERAKVKARHTGDLAFLKIADRIMWDALVRIAASRSSAEQHFASRTCERIENLRAAQNVGREVLDTSRRIVLEIGGRTFELTDPTPGGYFSISREQLDACRIGTEALDAAIARAIREQDDEHARANRYQLEELEREHRALAARERVKRGFEATGLRGTAARVDLAIEAAHGVLQIADAVHHGEIENARHHADDLATVFAALLGSLAANVRAPSPRTDREDA